MKCPSLKQLSAYVDRELTFSEIQKIDIHLQDCLTCRIEVARLRKLIRSFQKLADEDTFATDFSLEKPDLVSQEKRVIALLILLVGAVILFGHSNDHVLASLESECEYYYKDHKDYTQTGYTDYISLVLWE